MTLKSPAVLFGSYVVSVTALSYGILREVVHLAQRDPTSSHLVVVPLVSAALIYRNRHAIFRSASWDVTSALAVIAGAAACLAWGVQAGSLAAKVGGLVLLVVGGFVGCFGRGAARAASFPLLFLVFMVPIPAVILDAATRFLKHGSTEAVAMLFTLTGMPYFREGSTFALAGVTIEVADQCSGIRSSIGLLLTVLIAGNVLLTRTWTRALLVAIVIPLAVLKNAIRIAGLSALSLYVDEGFLRGQLHHEGGMVFFGIALLLLVPFVLLLQKFETDPSHGRVLGEATVR